MLLRRKLVSNFSRILGCVTTFCLLVCLWNKESCFLENRKGTEKNSGASQIYSRNKTEKKISSEQKTNYIERKELNISTSTTTDKDYNFEWLSCNELEPMLENLKIDKTSSFRQENDNGNRGVYFTKVLSPDRETLSIAIKSASIKNHEVESQLYRYRSAQREIDNLRTMRRLNWTGIPKLLGTCVKLHQIIYAVTMVKGRPICNENSTDNKCAMGVEILDFLSRRPYPQKDTLLWTFKVICFFKQFEVNRAFMEDMSGSNFYFGPENMDLFVVDADSVIFYENSRLFSRMSCRQDSECPRPNGNLWRSLALNHKIYLTCRESQGYCNNNTCRGIDASLHSCGVSRWLLAPVRGLIPNRAFKQFNNILHCLMEEKPQKRCSLTEACEKSEKLYNLYK